MKIKCYVFSAYKETNKVRLFSLVAKPQEDSYNSCIFRLKCQKTVERTSLEKGKQETR